MNNRLAAGSIYVAGHRGLAGSAILRRLASLDCRQIITRNHAELDLRDQAAVDRFFADQRPQYVFLCAAKVGGILANATRPAEFIYDNLAIQTNVLAAAQRSGVQRLLFLGSSCIYPRSCPQPIREEYLLNGPLEPTNRPYAVAKIAGIEMCWALNRQYGSRFLAAMPTNLYGPNDNYDLESSHVLPALLRKIHEAKFSGASEVVIWGTGKVRREFLHSDDMATACVQLMGSDDVLLERLFADENRPPMVNVGYGSDVTILELAQIIAEVVGYNGRFIFDTSKPDGAAQKLLDLHFLRSLGWKPQIALNNGLRNVYEASFASSAIASGNF